MPTEGTMKYKRNIKKKRKNGYKHVPHSEKPHQIVAKRNARERKRVHSVNQAFLRLRKALPIANKVIDFINKTDTMIKLMPLCFC